MFGCGVSPEIDAPLRNNSLGIAGFGDLLLNSKLAAERASG
jgi:hypothetical protein